MGSWSSGAVGELVLHLRQRRADVVALGEEDRRGRQEARKGGLGVRGGPDRPLDARRAALHDERAVLGAHRTGEPWRRELVQRDRQRRHVLRVAREALGPGDDGLEVHVGEAEPVAGDGRLGSLELGVGAEAGRAAGVDGGLDRRRVADGEDGAEDGVGALRVVQHGGHVARVRHQGDRDVLVGLGGAGGTLLGRDPVHPGLRLGGILDAQEHEPARLGGVDAGWDRTHAGADLAGEPRLDVARERLLAIRRLADQLVEDLVQLDRECGLVLEAREGLHDLRKLRGLVAREVEAELRVGGAVGRCPGHDGRVCRSRS